MEIVGNGFLARSLQPISHLHPDTVVVLAAGVSWASGVSEADFARERDLLDSVAARCVAESRHLLFFSTASSGMYGRVRSPAREDDEVTPCSPYGAHKLALEERLRSSGAAHLILRLGHLVGPGQPAHQLVPSLVEQMRKGSVTVQRSASRDLVDVDDVVRVIDRLLAQGLSGTTVNVASGESVPVDRIVDHLQSRLELAVDREYADGGSCHVVSIDRLRTLVPEVEDMGFAPGYYRRVLDRFVASTGLISR
jgi:nucleoside-diphosphate-sugar epimerase